MEKHEFFNKSKLSVWTVISIATLVFSAVAQAKFASVPVEKIPTARLIANAEKKLKKAPTSAPLLYALGRAHSIASVQSEVNVTTHTRGGSIQGSAYFGRNAKSNIWMTNVNGGTRKVDKKHTAKAIEYYKKSLKQDATNLVTSLGLAWSLEQSGKIPEAKELYEKVMKAAWKKERNSKYNKNMKNHNWSITVEAGGYLLPLLDKKKDKTTFNVTNLRIKHIGRNGTSGPVTPIIIPMDRKSDRSSLKDLVDPKIVVSFNLDGRGARGWEWVKPTTGFLVYIDDWNKPEVTSGLSMFGTVTFWMFWENGYQALASLDDNDDGYLGANELDQIGVWQDLNQNGISETSEIFSAKQLRISAIRTDYEAYPNTAGYQPKGIFYQSGEITPSYDWLSQPRNLN